jgi:hypothetical protein
VTRSGLFGTHTNAPAETISVVVKGSEGCIAGVTVERAKATRAVALWRKRDKDSQGRARCRTTFQRFVAIAFAGRIATLADVA